MCGVWVFVVFGVVVLFGVVAWGVVGGVGGGVGVVWVMVIYYGWGGILR